MNKEDFLKLSDEDKVSYVINEKGFVDDWVKEEIVLSFNSKEKRNEAIALLKDNGDMQRIIIESLSEEDIIQLLENIQFSDMVSMVLILPKEYWKQCLENPNIVLDSAERRRIEENIKKENDFQKATQIIREEAKKEDFIIDGDDTRIGNTDLKNLVNLEFSEGGKREELVWVHSTDYFPTNGTILNTKNAKGLDGVKGGIYAYSHRNTIHGALNHKVASSNEKDNWQNTKFVILQPFEKIEERIVDVSPVDSFVLGNMTLSEDAIILVNEEEYNNLTDEQQKDGRIIKYKGDCINAVNKAMILLGRKPQKGEKDCITNSNNNRKITKLSKNENLLQGKHWYSLYAQYERNCRSQRFSFS